MHVAEIESLIDEVTPLLRKRTFVTISNPEGFKSELDSQNKELGRLWVLEQLVQHCEALGEDVIFVTMRTVVMDDPEDRRPALVRVCGYVLNAETWVRISKTKVEHMYAAGLEDGEELWPISRVFFV